MFNIKSFKDWKNDYDSGLLRKKDEIEELLFEKYGKKFNVYSYISCFGVVYADKWGVISEDNDRFTVMSEHSNEYAYSDNYHSILLKAELTGKVRHSLEKEFDDFDFNIEIHSKSKSPLSNENYKSFDFILYAKLFVNVGKYENENLTDRIYTVLSDINSNNTKIWSKWFFSKENEKKSDICFIKGNGTIINIPCQSKTNRNNRLLELAELEWLVSVIYLDEFIEYSRLNTLGEIAEYVRDFVFPLKNISTEFPIEITKGQWLNILNSIIDNSLLSSLKIIKSIDVNEINHLLYPDIYIGHRGICLIDDLGNAYVVFRGTCGDLEWYDNAVGMTVADTKQQKAAANFLLEVCDDKRVKTITITGHSKGGNKAQYSYITVNDMKIIRCVSFDGQGFSNEFMEKYSKEIKEKYKNIQLVAERRDFVNCLGNWLYETEFYTGWRGDSVPGLKYGYSLPFFHCADAIYDRNNRYDLYGKVGSIPDLINQFMLYILNDEKYSEIKETTILAVISLMMIDRKNSNMQVAEALLNITIIVCDLISNNVLFCEKIIQIFNEEEKTLLATFELLDPKNKENSPLKPELPIIVYYIENITARFFRDKDFRRNFLSSIRFIISSLTDTLGSVQQIHVGKFLEGLVKGISTKSVNYSTNPSLNKRLEEIRSAYELWRGKFGVERVKDILIDKLDYKE